MASRGHFCDKDMGGELWCVAWCPSLGVSGASLSSAVLRFLRMHHHAQTRLRISGLNVRCAFFSEERARPWGRCPWQGENRGHLPLAAFHCGQPASWRVVSHQGRLAPNILPWPEHWGEVLRVDVAVDRRGSVSQSAAPSCM